MVFPFPFTNPDHANNLSLWEIGFIGFCLIGVQF
jgi:hypothetical protein